MVMYFVWEFVLVLPLLFLIIFGGLDLAFWGCISPMPRLLANDSNDTKNSPGSVVSMCGGYCDDFIYAFLDVERRERLLNMVAEF